jgi:hypothetical protein
MKTLKKIDNKLRTGALATVDDRCGGGLFFLLC